MKRRNEIVSYKDFRTGATMKQPDLEPIARAHLEDDLQIMVANWLRMAYPRLTWIHVPNGGKRNIVEARKFKRMGVKPGVPDLLFFDWCAYLELKVGKNKPKVVQVEFMERLDSMGWIGAVAWNFEEAMEKILEFEQIRRRI